MIRYNIIYYGFLLILSVLFNSGCVWVDRPPAPMISKTPPTCDKPVKITVVRKEQLALSAAIFTLTLDGLPVANLNTGEYTSFSASQGEHSLSVMWGIGGLNVIIPYGVYIDESVNMYSKNISVKCLAGKDHYITIEAKIFGMSEEERVILKQVDRLQGDFSVTDKVYVQPWNNKPK